MCYLDCYFSSFSSRNFAGDIRNSLRFFQEFQLIKVNDLSWYVKIIISLIKSLLTAECIWFKCDLYLQFIPPINIWNIWNDLRPFLKCKEGPFSRSWRSLRSNSLEIQNDENSKSKLAKTRWNPKFGLSDLENDLLTSTTSEWAQSIFSKITFLKSGDQAEKNEACLSFLEEIFAKSVHRGGV